MAARSPVQLRGPEPLRADAGAQTPLFPSGSVPRAIRESHCSDAVHPAVFPSTTVNLAVRLNRRALATDLPTLPPSLVSSSTFEKQDAFPVHFVVLPSTTVRGPVRPGVSALSMHRRILELPDVLVPLGIV
eukprot:CAMPEP_0204345896 /NCGR_PEP_ID=MMETSP0469-20131031/26746_1 /ASSEMBLY_ACC=CAM_ASM_000384 /TAXON_ID=2969 /ORGANISM="Oxyrrhis marina" /LENGTH=130 /DNA_ID=CAMNT_0051331413 /DNA_START=69 /DNA_END=458 /DNA_ORIENTATION=-